MIIPHEEDAGLSIEEILLKEYRKLPEPEQARIQRIAEAESCAVVDVLWAQLKNFHEQLEDPLEGQKIRDWMNRRYVAPFGDEGSNLNRR